MQRPHLPYPAAIEGYGSGGFRFAGMSHRGSLLCLPSGLYAWKAERPSDFTQQAFASVMEEAERIDLLLVGTGGESVAFSKALRHLFLERSIQVDAMPTGAAAQTWNILLSENRRVAAALLATP